MFIACQLGKAYEIIWKDNIHGSYSLPVKVKPLLLLQKKQTNPHPETGRSQQTRLKMKTVGTSTSISLQVIDKGY